MKDSEDSFSKEENSIFEIIFKEIQKKFERNSVIINNIKIHTTMEMNNWYECKVKYEKTLENGIQKKVTEAYLVDALSFTEAENRIIEEMKPYISGEFEV